MSPSTFRWERDEPPSPSPWQLLPREHPCPPRDPSQSWCLTNASRPPTGSWPRKLRRAMRENSQGIQCVHHSNKPFANKGELTIGGKTSDQCTVMLWPITNHLTELCAARTIGRQTQKPIALGLLLINRASLLFLQLYLFYGLYLFSSKYL